VVVLVTGGRNYTDLPRVYQTLDKIHEETPISRLVAGDASGADEHALAWAECANVDRKRYEADWAKYGKAAGPRRNAEMLKSESPQLVVAFPGGSGTADMTTRAKAAKVRVIVIDERVDVIAALRESRDALTRAKQFIENGIEFGYIDPLKPGSPESQTPGIIRKAITAATKALGEM